MKRQPLVAINVSEPELAAVKRWLAVRKLAELPESVVDILAERLVGASAQ